jgi:hypothetical protein
MGETCGQNCAQKCNSKINDNEREKLFKYFYNTDDYGKRHFVNRTVEK